jgi:hypothetical protein
MFGLNPFAQIDPFELEQMKKARGLLGQAFEPPPMVQPPQQPMAPPPQMAPQPGMTPGPQMLPPLDIVQPQPPQPSAPPPRMVGAPPPQGPEPDVPLPPQRPPEFSAPTPDQRQLQATTAGTPQDQQPQSGPFGMDLSKLGEGLSGGLDRMTSDPLFNLGIGILSNPRNIGQGLAAGLQSARAAKDSERRNKLAEQAANRKNIHWFTRPDGTLAGVNADNPSELVVPPGQTPRNTEGKILQPGEGGVPQGFVGVQNPGGTISLHPLPQSQDQKLEAAGAEAKVKAEAQANVAQSKEQAKADVKAAADRQKAQQTAGDIWPVYQRAIDAYERASKASGIGPWAASPLMRSGGSLAGTEAENARVDYEKALAELKLRKAQEFMKGQGATSNMERAMVGEMFPQLNAPDAEAGLKLLRGWRDLAKRRASGDWTPMPEEAPPPAASGSVQAAPSIGVGEARDFGGGVKIRRVR